MTRQTILDSINAMMRSYAENGGYNISQAVEIVTENDEHWIKYEIRMSNGTFKVDLHYKNGGFDFSYNDEYSGNKNSMDYEELGKASKHFDRVINSPEMVKMFSYLN